MLKLIGNFSDIIEFEFFVVAAEKNLGQMPQKNLGACFSRIPSGILP